VIEPIVTLPQIPRQSETTPVLQQPEPLPTTLLVNNSNIIHNTVDFLNHTNDNEWTTVTTTMDAHNRITSSNGPTSCYRSSP
jgi:hypothetical protein